MATIEEKIKRQSEKLAALKAKAKAAAKAKAEQSKVELLKNQIAVGAVVLSWRESDYRMSLAELRAEIEKIFSNQNQNQISQTTTVDFNQTTQIAEVESAEIVEDED